MTLTFAVSYLMLSKNEFNKEVVKINEKRE
jgi:hypothetical protein